MKDVHAMLLAALLAGLCAAALEFVHGLEPAASSSPLLEPADLPEAP